MTTFYRHGPREGQPVTLEGLLGVCDVCGRTAVRHVWDRREAEPVKNFMGIWCRQIAPVEPPHRWCERHTRAERVELRFADEAEWEDWKARNP